MGGDGQVLADLVVGEALHGQLLIGCHRADVVEVEAQPSGVAQRAGLPDVGAEDGAQGGVEQVGAAVVAGCVQAAFGLHLAGHGVAQRDVALGDHAAMDDEPATGLWVSSTLTRPLGPVMTPRSPTCPPPSA